MSREAEYCLMRGVAAAKSQEISEARNYLERVAHLEPDRYQMIEAWWWLSSISTDPKEQRELICQILSYNPADGRARRQMAILDGKLKAEDIINPDDVQSTKTSDGPDPADARRFTCPQCGGRMTFTPSGQSLTCEYCQSRQMMAGERSGNKNTLNENDYYIGLAKAQGHLTPVSRKTFNCQGCGLEFILPPDRLSITCPNCLSSHVVLNNQPREIADPNSIIPFQVDEKSAKSLFKDWLLRKPLSPPPNITQGTGIYLPAWSFTIGGELPWQTFIKQDKKWVPLQGVEVVFATNVMIPATKKVPRAWQKLLNSYRLEELIPFDIGYLADWPAETYQISMVDASLEARRIHLAEKRRSIEFSISSDHSDISTISTSIIVESYSLLLLPVWIIHYTYQEKVYQVVINGQNGAIEGEGPARGVLKWLNKLLK